MRRWLWQRGSEGIPGPLRVTCELPQTVHPGDGDMLAVRPETIGVSASPVAAGPQGRITRKVYPGNRVDFRVAAGPLEARVAAEAGGDDRAEGSEVWLELRKVFAFPLA